MNNTPALTVPSAAVSIPSNPRAFRQKSDTCLPATPSLAYPASQSFCVRRKHPISLFNIDNTEAACTIGKGQLTAPSEMERRCAYQNTSSYPRSGNLQGGTALSGSWDGYWRSSFLAVSPLCISFGVGHENLGEELGQMLQIALIFECYIIYFFSAGNTYNRGEIANWSPIWKIWLSHDQIL